MALYQQFVQKHAQYFHKQSDLQVFGAQLIRQLSLNITEENGLALYLVQV